MELSVECADVTARLHCLLPGTLTPVAEYLELRAAVEGGDGGWRLKYRSWDGGKPHERQSHCALGCIVSVLRTA